MLNSQRKKKLSIEPDDGYCEDRDYNNRPWEDWEREAEERARKAHPGLWEYIETLAQEDVNEVARPEAWELEKRYGKRS